MSSKPKKVVIKKSSKAGKKLQATFSYPGTTRTKTTHFGSAGMTITQKPKIKHNGQDT